MTVTGTVGGSPGWLLLAVPAGLAGVAGAVALAAPAGAPLSAGPQLLAQLAGVLVVGLCVVERLEDERRRDDLRAQVRPTLVVTTVAWLVCELALLVATAGESRGSTFGASTGQVLGYATGVSGGRVSLLTGACVLGALVLSRGTSLTPVLALAGVAVVARPLTGHLDGSGVLLAASVAHVGAAGVWCGGLVAVALVSGTARGTWARLLPRISAVALWCVVVLTASGVVEALYLLGSVQALVTTGYGRVVLAKIVVLAVLVGLGWWARRRWVPRAAAHRLDARVSTRQAVLELLVMAVALGLATALSGTAVSSTALSGTALSGTAL